MTRKGHSYLDLTALSEIGAMLLTAQPAWFWSLDDGAILWANAGGAAYLEVATIEEALERSPSHGPRPLNLSELAESLSAAAPRMARLRFADDEERSLWCLCSRLELEDGTAGLLAAAVDEGSLVDPLPVRAGRLAQSVAGNEMVVAIARPGGRIIAASEGLGQLTDGERLIGELAEETTVAGRRLLKRVAQFGIERRAAGAATADTPDGHLMLVIIGPPQASVAASDMATSESEPTGMETPQEVMSAHGERNQRHPTRFAFRIDQDRQFADLSPEFAVIVGPTADLVGRSWDDIAERLGLDNRGIIATALSRRDTWSGVTLHWPIAGKDERIVLDLTALPSFGSDGLFEGHRGFGVLRSDPALGDRQTKAAASQPLPSSAEEAEASEPSNVVKLPSANDRSEPRQADLSGDEQDAFRRIAEALRAIGPRKAAMGSGDQGKASAQTADPAFLGSQATAVAAPAPASVPTHLLDRIPIGIVVFRDQTVLFANRAFLDRLGYADVSALAAAGGVDGLFAEATSEASADGPEPLTQVPLRAADGRHIAAEARLHVVPWDNGTATMLSVRGLTTRADDLRLADQKSTLTRIDELEAVLDTATDGILVLNADGQIQNLNRSAEALFGVEAPDMLGQPFTALLAEESHKSATDYLDGLARNGVASVLNDGREVIGRVPTGGLIPLFMTMGRVSDQGKFCVVLRDLTHWKTAEEELVAARRSAELANQQKSKFLAKISHEIRTPLTAIIGFSDVILEERFGPIGTERYREYLKDIRLSGTHLMSLINDLLDLSKIEAGKLDLSFSAVAINQIVQECVALMQPEANRRRIIIRTSLAGDLPKVVADERSLRQIVLNLLSNAVKFNIAGGQAIVSTAFDDCGEVVLRIRDTGIGMSDKDIETALKPFQQIATSGPARFEGTGLGLPLTKALVEANRASFAINSTPDEGTLVRINFPVERVLQA